MKRSGIRVSVERVLAESEWFVRRRFKIGDEGFGRNSVFRFIFSDGSVQPKGALIRTNTAFSFGGEALELAWARSPDSAALHAGLRCSVLG